MSEIISNRVCFFDGDNFVVVTKNCSRETAQKIMRALTAVDLYEGTMISPAEVAPMIEPEEVIPPIPENDPSLCEDSRIPYGRYAGKTPEEVLTEEGEKGYGNLAFLLTKEKYRSMHNAIREALDSYFQTRFASMKKDPYTKVAEISREQCRTFFLYFGSLLSNEEKESVSSQAGMLDFDAFLKEATDEQLRSLVASVLTKNLK